MAAREHPGLGNLQLLDGRIIGHFLLPARWFVEQGGMAARGEMAGAFSRGGKEGIIRENNRRLAALRDSLKPMPYQGHVLNVVMTVKEYIRP